MSLRERPKTDFSEVRKILIVRLRRMGDILMTTPALRGLREAFPGAHLTYVVEEPYRGLLEGHGALDEVLVLPNQSGLSAFARALRKIRRERFDAVVDFHGGPRAFQLTMLSGAPVKIGYRVKYKGALYTHSLSRQGAAGPIHSVVNHYNLVRILGVPGTPGPLESAPAGEEDVRRLNELLSARGLEGGSFIVFHFSAGNRAREWGVDNAAALVNLFTRRTELPVVLVGGPADRETAAAVLTRGGRAYSFVGEISLKQLYRLIAKSRLFVGPDSGPMHLAAAARVPIVAYFGPSIPEIFGPWKAEAMILQKNMDCRPCSQRECVHGDFRCHQSITPEEVCDACLKVLEG